MSACLSHSDAIPLLPAPTVAGYLPAPTIAGLLPAPRIPKRVPKVTLSDGRKMFFVPHEESVNVWIRYPNGDSHWYSKPIGDTDIAYMHTLWSERKRRRDHVANAA